MWFTESRVVLVISILLVVLFTKFILDKMKKKVVLYQVKQLYHIIQGYRKNGRDLKPL